jgi:phosphinothricin acetyltransferase
MSLAIRPAAESDLPAILAIYNHAIVHTTAVYDYEPHTLAMREAWYVAKVADQLPVLVATLGEQVVGFAALSWFRAWAAYRYTVENSLYVAPDQQGQGIGKQLLSASVAAARDRGFHTIVSGIDADNAASLHLHRQFGFEAVGQLHQVGYKFDRWLDLTFMQLLLIRKSSC